MRETMRITANYGVLAHEGKPVYTRDGVEHMHAASSEPVEVRLPEGWHMGKNTYGFDLLVDPSGETWGISDILASGKDGQPVLAVPAGPDGCKYYGLEVVEQ